MWCLLTVHEKITVPPSLASADTIDSAIRNILCEKYLGRILPREGLCAKVQGFIQREAFVVHGHGDVLVEVESELLMFRPYNEEGMEGTIKESTEEGIVVTLGFIDAFVPAYLLMEPSYLGSGQSKAENKST